MIVFLIVLFAITLIYISKTERFRTYLNLIALQGVLLFLISFVSIFGSASISNLIFIIFETLLFKAIVIPLLLKHIISKIKISRVHEKSLPSFYSLIFISFGLLISVIISQYFKSEKIEALYFSISVFTLFTGLFLIVSHKKIFSHMIGFLVIENAVFLLSLAVGLEMPLLINLAIFIDIIVSVLILGLFINKMSAVIEDVNSEELSMLKD
ncbi:MAG: hypothetical protein A2X12_12075 [Bacteroidetes bacterium GWE2_29_8]|nr:MAG: hypothetical protein A2X12_12075 [Bacteroidetes bacterium GWE2_29_8]OFY24514.1 MAG: hypothetical protein A2X02_01860 [Bacteroidetes bacterium GWF2_29_10]